MRKLHAPDIRVQLVHTWHKNKGILRLLIFGGTLLHYGIASYMQKHHYFYVVHSLLSTSKGVGNRTINAAASLPLAPHAPVLRLVSKKKKKGKKSHDALPSFPSLFIFRFPPVILSLYFKLVESNFFF